MMAGGGPTLARRIGASLAFGFLSVFGFAFLMQAAVDFLHDILNIRIKFLLPFGLSGAHLAPDVFMDIVGGLVTVSLGVSAAFFFLIQRQDRLAQRRVWRDEED